MVIKQSNPKDPQKFEGLFCCAFNYYINSLPLTRTLPLIIDNLSDKVYLAAQQFQKAIEDMGATEVTIMYCYNSENSCHTGGAYKNVPLVVGALEIMKHDLLNP